METNPSYTIPISAGFKPSSHEEKAPQIEFTPSGGFKAITRQSYDDLTMLAVLGIVFDTSAKPEMIVSAVKHLIGTEWQPTTDVISTRIEQALSAGFLVVSEEHQFVDAKSEFLELSSRGKERFRFLMCAVEPLPLNRIGRTFISLKVCFLDLLNRRDQERLLWDIREYYLETKKLLENRCADCPRNHRCVRRQIELEIDRIQWESNRLVQLARRLT